MIHGLGSAIFENAGLGVAGDVGQCNAPCVPFHHSGFFLSLPFRSREGMAATLWTQLCQLSAEIYPPHHCCMA